MSADTISIVIPLDLRDLIAAAAAERDTTQDIAATTLLQEQLALAEAARAHGEPLAARYLTHPRLTVVPVHARTTVHIARQVNERAADLAAALTEERGEKVPKGRVMQALLWAALDPVPDAERRALSPAVAPRDTITARIPLSLNAELLDLAMRRGTSREAVTDDLLDQVFAELAADPRLRDSLRQQLTEPSTGSPATLQVPRQHDAPLQQLATDLDMAKSRALQAVLRYGLDHTDRPPETNTPDRPVLISGPLYARVAQLALEQRAERGRAVSIRELVEAAVEQALKRAETRRKP